MARMEHVEGPTPTLEDLRAAQACIKAYVKPTPLLRYPGMVELLGAEVWVKHENHHVVGAFKVRGGVNLASHLTPLERRAGLFTASTGNHGQSIAFAGSVTGTPTLVAVPEGANPEKVAAMRRLGAEVVAHGKDFDEAREFAAALAVERGGRFIGPTDPELIAGVGTYALEIVDELPDVDVIIVPVGAGSGASGVCIGAKGMRPGLRVIGVQAEQAPAMRLAWKAGEAVDAPMRTRAEGLATRVPFDNTQRIMRDPKKGLDDFVLVSDETMEEAIVLLLEHTHNLAEHAGAASLAAALMLREELVGKQTVVVLSGGNLFRESLVWILASRSH